MTVLKSFELNGNKQSFANWISNLSPKDVPFTSMIGKEKIDQTQYSWQTDALAPATPEAILEGEQFDAQPRASTQVITNFTSILRRAVRVSDTATKVATYGRSNEMAYQLKKAASELLRDVEFQNLSTQYGHPGADGFYSNQGGFKSLVATVNHPDPDTKAVVHTEIAWRKNKPAFTLKDIFEITSNLYLAGSKADKIMFHPAHVHIFSDHMGYNEEEPLVYRMFDNVDTKFNMSVCKVKDPLGRMYTLIPNRYMPQDHVYIFNETDWTQTILRAPERIKIGKKGSSETMVIETQIGLRHRHPYASGILGLIRTEYIAALTADHKVLTAYTGEEDKIAQLMLTQEAGGAGVANHFINWESSDRDILFLKDASGETNATGYASAKLHPGKPGTTTIRVTGDKVISNPVHIEVRAPVLDLEVHGAVAEAGKVLSTTMEVTRHSGDKAANGIDVYWHASSPEVVFTNPVGHAITDHTKTEGGTGVAAVNVTALHPGTYHIWGTVGGIPSKKKTIYIGKSQLVVDWVTTIPKLYVGIDKEVKYAVEVKDAAGNAVGAGLVVNWAPSDRRIFDVFDYNYNTLTDASGIAEVKMTPHTSSSAIENLKANVYGNVISTPVLVKGVHVRPKVVPHVIPLNSNGIASISTPLIDTDGLPIPGIEVNWAATPGDLIELTSVSGDTNDSGIATTSIKGLAKVGSGTIASKVGSMTVSTTFTVGTGGDLSFSISPSPSTLNKSVTLSGKVFDKDRNPVSGQLVTFNAAGGAWAVPDSTTGADGSYTSSVTASHVGSFNVVARCESVGAQKTIPHTTKPVKGRQVKTRTGRSVATFGVNEFIKLTAEVTDTTRSVANLDISIIDPNGKFQFTQDSGKTDAQGKWETDLICVGQPGDNTILYVESEGVVGEIPMSIEAPVIKIEVDPNPAIVNTTFAATASVFLEDGVTPVSDKVSFEWNVTPNDLVEFQEPAYETNTNGQLVILANLINSNEHALIANVGTSFSNRVVLHSGLLSSDIKSDGTGNMSSNVGEERIFRAVASIGGVPASNMEVTITSSNTNVLEITTATTGVTDAAGEFVFTGRTGSAVGTVVVTANITEPVTGYISTSTMNVISRNPKVNTTLSSTTMKIHEEMDFEIELLDQNSLPIQGVTIEALCDAASTAVIPPEGVTDSQGKIYAKLAPILPGVQKVRGKVGTFSGLQKSVTVNNTVDAAEVLTQPLAIGGKSQAKILVKNDVGMALANKTVTWSVTPANVVTGASATTTTDQNGMSLLEMTGVSRGTGVVSYEVEGMTAKDSTFLVGHGANFSSHHTPEKPAINQNVTHSVRLTRAGDGEPIGNTEVHLTCTPAVGTFPPTTVTTNAQGIAEFTNQFVDENTHTILATVPAFTAEATHLVEVQPPNSSNDQPHIHTITGNNILQTHSTGIGLPITMKSIMHSSPSLGMRMDCISLDPSIATAVVPDIPTNSAGEITFQVFGVSAGTARFRAKARGAVANYVEFTVRVGNPSLTTVITPQNLQGGKRIEFAAVLKDANDDWVPGAKVHWIYPHNMLGGGLGLEEKETDQFGRTYYDRIAALWGTHAITAVLTSNPAVRSITRNVTITM